MPGVSEGHTLKSKFFEVVATVVTVAFVVVPLIHMTAAPYIHMT